jgi:hypothetical protein
MYMASAVAEKEPWRETSVSTRSRFKSSIRGPYQSKKNFLLRLSVRHGKLRHMSPALDAQVDGVTIRRLGGEDLAASRRLAQLDSHPPLEEPLLGIEIEGRLVAAISLQTGESVADPFSRTAELRALLELRAAQLQRRDRGRRLRRGLLRPSASSAPLSSPRGAPSWLIAHRPRGF